MSNSLSGRVFGASLKPAWNEQKIQEFLNKTKGDIMVYLINHDNDLDKNGEPVETHTHIYLLNNNTSNLKKVGNLVV